MNSKPTFLHQNQPLITCMIQAATPEEAIADIRNAASDGADAFGFQMCRMDPRYRSEETLRSVFRQMGNRPLYLTSYRAGFNEGQTDDTLAQGMLLGLRYGANLVDVMGDLFCRDPRELTDDAEAVNKQRKLIDEIHARGGEVLMSSHLYRYAPADEVLEIAKAQQARGADIAKIVTGATTQEQELENLRITALLRRELDIPFLFLSTGSHTRLHRTIGPMLGCCMWLTVADHNALSTKAQPVCRSIRAIVDHFDYQPERDA